MNVQFLLSEIEKLDVKLHADLDERETVFDYRAILVSHHLRRNIKKTRKSKDFDQLAKLLEVLFFLFATITSGCATFAIFRSIEAVFITLSCVLAGFFNFGYVSEEFRTRLSMLHIESEAIVLFIIGISWMSLSVGAGVLGILSVLLLFVRMVDVRSFVQDLKSPSMIHLMLLCRYVSKHMVAGDELALARINSLKYLLWKVYQFASWGSLAVTILFLTRTERISSAKRAVFHVLSVLVSSAAVLWFESSGAVIQLTRFSNGLNTLGILISSTNWQL